MAKDSIRRFARGKECTVQLPCCNHDPATTVLAHLRMSGITGIGQKAPDILGAHCCSSCHVAVDTYGHSQEYDRDFVRLAFFEGVMRTQYRLIKAALLKL